MYIKNLISIYLLLMVALCTTSNAEEYTFAGVYQGKNIYVQNPLSEDQQKFCTKAVYVNNLLVVNNPKTSAYEIDLSFLQQNEPIMVKIIHSSGCIPKVINPQVVKPKNKFQFLSVYVDSDLIRWITKSEQANAHYVLEQYVEDKWIALDRKESKAGDETSQYQSKPKHTAGINRYRVKYITSDDVFFSDTQQYFAETAPVTFKPDTIDEKIVFSRETDYELLDAEGNQVVQGKGKELDIENLSAGLYYLNIENRTEKIIKK